MKKIVPVISLLVLLSYIICTSAFASTNIDENLIHKLVRDFEGLTESQISTIQNALSDKDFYSIWYSAIRSDLKPYLNDEDKMYEVNELFISYVDLFDRIYPNSNYLKYYRTTYQKAITGIEEYYTYQDIYTEIKDLDFNTEKEVTYKILKCIDRKENTYYFDAINTSNNKKYIIAGFSNFPINSEVKLHSIKSGYSFEGKEIHLVFENSDYTIIQNSINSYIIYFKCLPYTIFERISLIENI